MKKIVPLLVLFLFLLPTNVLAKVGVGVGTGRITVEDELRPGQSYTLPPFSVLNTGDEPSDYEISIAFHQNQESKMPDEKWFSFKPSNFYLEPGGVQSVEVVLNLPVRAEPGDYFAFLEAHPKIEKAKGGTSIGVAAASKLYFKIVPATFLQGLYYKLVSFWQRHSPWTYAVSAAVVVGIVVGLARKHLNIEISVGKKEKGKEEEKKQNEE